MFSTIIKLAIISLIIIAFIHYFYVYFKNKLTKPKIIDLASSEKIDEINSIISKKKELNDNANNKVNIEVSEKDNYNTMSNELSSFLNSELKNN